MGFTRKIKRNNMNTKAIFFDVDGTLWDENMCIPKSTRVALKELKENGNLMKVPLTRRG